MAKRPNNQLRLWVTIFQFLCMKYEFLIGCLLDLETSLSSKDQSTLCIPYVILACVGSCVGSYSTRVV